MEQSEHPSHPLDPPGPCPDPFQGTYFFPAVLSITCHLSLCQGPVATVTHSCPKWTASSPPVPLPHLSHGPSTMEVGSQTLGALARDPGQVTRPSLCPTPDLEWSCGHYPEGHCKGAGEVWKRG